MNIPENKTYDATLLSIENISSNVYEVRFKMPDFFSYEVGQYVWVVLPELLFPDIAGQRRAFSIINPLDKTGVISVLFRDTGSGWKKTLLQMDLNSRVQIIGPFGSSFSLPKETDRKIVCIAGGVGIAPFLCWIRYVVAQKTKHEISLLYFDSDGEKTPFSDEIISLCKKNKKSNCKIYSERINESLLNSIKKLKESKIYISGPQSFVNEANQMLVDIGISASDMVFENFYPQTSEMVDLGNAFRDYINTHHNQKEKLVKSNITNVPEIIFNAIENSLSHAIITDPNGIILFANKAAQNVTGFSLDEMRGNTPRLWGGQMSDEFYKKLWKEKMASDYVKTELINRRKNGELYNVRAYITAIRDTQGKIVCYIAHEEDITDIRKSEKILSDERTRLKNIIEGTNVGTWEWNVQTGETIFSERWANIIGYTLDELGTISIKTWEKYAHPDDLANSNLLLQKHFNGETDFYDSKNRMKHKDGHWVWVWDRGKVVSRTADGKPLWMYGTHQDITVEQNRQEELKNRTDELERLNKITIDRELKMIELKKEISDLKTDKTRKYE